MAALMGRTSWYGAGCACCNGPRGRGQVRAAERRAWLADWVDDMAHAEAERYDLETLGAMLCGFPWDRYGADSLWR